METNNRLTDSQFSCSTVWQNLMKRTSILKQNLHVTHMIWIFVNIKNSILSVTKHRNCSNNKRNQRPTLWIDRTFEFLHHNQLYYNVNSGSSHGVHKVKIQFTIKRETPAFIFLLHQRLEPRVCSFYKFFMFTKIGQTEFLTIVYMFC